MATKIFQRKEILEAFSKILHPNASSFAAMYNSRIDGIIKDQDLMTIPLDEHMAHRGHAVFDTLTVAKGRAVHLDFHLSRLAKSARGAKIDLPMSEDMLKSKILNTVASTGLQNCKARYWLSAGPGSFNVYPEAKMSAFYVMVLNDDPTVRSPPIKEFTSSIPVKSQLLATIKSTNYLVNALVSMESREKGGSFGIQTDKNGFITEGSVANVGFLLPGNVFLTIPFNEILHGITIRRVIDYANELKEKGVISKVEVRPIHIDEAKKCREMIMTGAECVTPVAEWDGVPIEKTDVSQMLSDLVYNEMFQHEFSIPVPYEDYSGN